MPGGSDPRPSARSANKAAGLFAIMDEASRGPGPVPDGFPPVSPSVRIPAVTEPPPNPAGGRTLLVDPSHGDCYPLPSAAIEEAGPTDQVFIRPGIYEDKIVVMGRPVRLIGAGRDWVQIFNRRGGPLYLQTIPEGLVTGIWFRYIGSDPHSAVNMLDSTCTVSSCRMTEGILSGIVIYGPQSRPTLSENEVGQNRESGIFIFAGARPYITKNHCHSNHHFGIAVRDPETHPDLVRNLCRDNRLSGMLLFHHAQALVLENVCRDNWHWGVVATPECRSTPALEALDSANDLSSNPRGPIRITGDPLSEIGR